MNPDNKKSIITHRRLFPLEQLSGKINLNSFYCSIEEYNEYLQEETNNKKRKTVSMRRDILFKVKVC